MNSGITLISILVPGNDLILLLLFNWYAPPLPSVLLLRFLLSDDTFSNAYSRGFASK
jgi:hypothetical protein